jgi:hypothetical protein
MDITDIEPTREQMMMYTNGLVEPWTGTILNIIKMEIKHTRIQ